MDNLKRAERYFHQALDQHMRGQWAVAETLYRSALAHAPDRLSVLGNLSAVLIEQHRFEEAVPLCERVLALDPDNVEALGHLGCCQRLLQGPEHAIPALERALRLRPDDFQANCILGVCLAGLDRPADALAHFDRALASHPGEPYCLAHRGLALARLDRVGEALEAYLQALGKDPACPVAGKGLRELLEDTERAPPPRGAGLDAVVLDAAQAPWAGPAVASGMIRRLLRANPAVSAWLSRIRVAWPERPPAARCVDSEDARKALSDPLLLPLLRLAPVLDRDFTPWLTALRHALTHTVFGKIEEGPASAALLELHAALAEQCALNGYAWERTAEEEAIVQRLHKLLGAALLSEHPPPARWIVAAACYRPLSVLPAHRRLAALEWPAPVAALLQAQLPAAPLRATAGATRH